MACLRGQMSDEQHRIRDDLVAPRRVLAHPRLAETELVEQLDDVCVAFVGRGRILSHRGMERRDKGPEPDACHGVSCVAGSWWASLGACDHSAGGPATHGVLLWDTRGTPDRREDAGVPG